MMPRVRRSFRFTPACVLLLAACGDATPGVTTSSDSAAMIEDIDGVGHLKQDSQGQAVGFL